MMEGILFWALNAFNTGLILGLIIHIKKQAAVFDIMYNNLQTAQQNNHAALCHLCHELEIMQNEIPNRVRINGETVRLYRKEENDK